MSELENERLPVAEVERLRRWRLILGSGEADGIECRLSSSDAGVDEILSALYDSEGEQERRGSLGGSAPKVARWLGDIRTYFPSSVVRVMQQDAVDRLGLKQLLLQPEMLDAVVPDVHLVATLLSLNRVLPETSRHSARQVVRKLVEEVEKRLANPLRQAVTGSLQRSVRNRRPRHNEIDWNRTLRANLKHYQPDLNTVIPETRIGYGRKGQALREIVLCVDQSGSMASSVVYSGIFGAVLASIRAVKTQVVVFDTAVVDLTHLLADPVDLLFGVQLGGGTDINRALSYCQTLITRPHDTILILISDLFEGGSQAEMLSRAAAIAASGVQTIALLALDDRGAPVFHYANAAHLAALSIPAFACTPDLFPDMIAAAIKRQDLTRWAAGEGITVPRATA